MNIHGRCRVAIVLIVACATVNPLHADARDIDSLKRDFTSGKPHEQEEAAAELMEQGGKAVEMFIDVLGGAEDKTTRMRASQLLQRMLSKRTHRNQRVLATLETLADSKDQLTSRASIDAIAEFKEDARALKALKRLSVEHRDESVRGAALGAILTNTGRAKNNAKFLKDRLLDPSDFVRLRAAGYLGLIGDKSGIQACMEVLARAPSDDKTRALQMSAAVSAGRIGDPESLPALRKVAGGSEYGPAQWDAKIAIKNIELAQTHDRVRRIEILRNNLADETYSRWAVNQLKDMAGEDVAKVLTEAAKDAKNPGSNDARAVLIGKGRKIE